MIDPGVLGRFVEADRGIVVTQADLIDALLVKSDVRVQTVNLHHLQLAQGSAEFRAALLSADLLTCDGWPVVRLARQLGRDVQRVTGADLVTGLLGTAGRTLPAGFRVGLLGAGELAGDRFQQRLAEVGCTLAWREHGRASAWDLHSLAVAIMRAELDLLIVAVTPPHGELISARLRAGLLGIPIVAVGGAIDMATGIAWRVPRIVSATGFGWMFRLVQEPRRLYRRYLIDGALFFVRHFVPTYARAVGKIRTPRDAP